MEKVMNKLEKIADYCIHSHECYTCPYRTPCFKLSATLPFAAIYETQIKELEAIYDEITEEHNG